MQALQLEAQRTNELLTKQTGLIEALVSSLQKLVVDRDMLDGSVWKKELSKAMWQLFEQNPYFGKEDLEEAVWQHFGCHSSEEFEEKYSPTQQEKIYKYVPICTSVLLHACNL